MKQAEIAKQMKKMQLLRPSGLNSHFIGAQLAFPDYIQQMRHIIAQARLDLHLPHAPTILEANSPFLWLPPESKSGTPWSKGVLLIHGLFDSPFMLRDIGRILQRQGFLVQSVLLPGHGTVPADLLHIDYQEWLQATEYGIHDLAKKVNQVYLAGFSLGSALALHHAWQKPFIRGLLLFSPALQVQKHLAWYLQGRRWLSSLLPAARWYRYNPQRTYVKYESFALNAAYQAYLLLQHTQRLLAAKPLPTPVWLVTSEDDETVCAAATLAFFKRHSPSQSRLLWYTNKPPMLDDPRILVRTSAYPKLKILDFSHTCIPIAPNNPHYGQQGDYQDFQHYHYQADKMQGEIHLGAIKQANLQRYTIQRLSYNPDFAFMVETLQAFLAAVED